ncbi:hypothetical protein OLMES_1304 [Oleiphilus messinensis]|uniref:Uncharacterized protein n=1 Tax=Oleiphilus messinensis TaxID=141451 RepID=A0A1Y0I7K8_9GAMM|nr:hypothetical protein [Oleiphilus messinensis]ARU55383.1 hypothetical protein OLMES_1304 [Oleiphilus messinensis]
MDQPTITVEIQGVTYHLCATDPTSLATLSHSDRQHLSLLLQALEAQARKQQSREAEVHAPVAENAAFVQDQAAGEHSAAPVSLGKTESNPDLKSRAEAERLAEQLMMQGRSQRSEPSKVGVYKWFVIALVVIFLLATVF